MTTIMNRFQGDPKIVIDEDGAELTFQAGQPVMDRGVENAVILSLFTESEWIGNTLVTRPTQKFGGRFLEAIKQPITVSALNDIRNAALSDLNALIEVGLFEEIDVAVKNPESKKLSVLIVVKPPGSELEVFLLTNNGLLWTFQTIDPASARL